MFPERWLSGNYRQTHHSRLTSRPHKHRRRLLAKETLLTIVFALQAGTSWNNYKLGRCGHTAGGVEAEEQKQRRRRNIMSHGKGIKIARTIIIWYNGAKHFSLWVNK
eukprot:14543483-Heterocapsa_arctica.AAC.1